MQFFKKVDKKLRFNTDFHFQTIVNTERINGNWVDADQQD
jgi:hypothetical protein